MCWRLGQENGYWQHLIVSQLWKVGVSVPELRVPKELRVPINVKGGHRHVTPCEGGFVIGRIIIITISLICLADSLVHVLA